MPKCSVCGTELEEGQKFCFECGAPVPQTKKCIKCGAELPLKMKFCPECGTKQDGTANASGSGFSMGDKNVIAGDVIGHKEETHVAGNATFIKNEDQTKQIKKCHVCGSLVQIIDGFDCPECGQFTCQNCYDEKEGCCTECAEKHGEQKTNRYKEALKMVLADGRIEFSERKELISLQQELGISAEKAKQFEEEVKKAALGVGSEITTFEKVSMDKARALFYKEGNIKEALNLLEPVYKAHENDEKVLDIYLPVLAESAPLEALNIINSLQIDILTAFVVSIGIYIKQKNLVEAEKRLNQALRIWHESALLKCYNVLFNYAMYKQFNDSSFMEKARSLGEQLGEAQTELELSFQVKVQAMLQQEAGEAIADFDKDFCEQNHLLWYVMQGNLISNIDKNNVTVGKDDKADFKTIQQALNYVNDGATINILPGLYNEHLSFKKSVILIGCKDNIENKSSNELPIVVLDSSKSCEINVSVKIEGIVFTHEHNLKFDNLTDFINQKIDFKDNVYEDCKYGDDNFKSLFWIKSNSYLKNIAVLCAECYAVTFSKEAPVLEKSIIFHSYDNCLYVREKSNPSILNCKISNSRYPGIVISDEANPSISMCEIFNHLETGIDIDENASGNYSECYIHNNEGGGVYVYDKAKPNFNDCNIINNHGIGINISEEAEPRIINCKIEDNKNKDCPGIVCEGNSKPVINSCVITGHLSYGIEIKDKAEGSYTDCEIHDNESFGLYVTENANPNVENSKIYNNIHGILVKNKASGTYDNCEIYNNSSGISVWECAKPYVVDCKVYKNRAEGINIGDEGAGLYDTCDIYDNEEEGIYVSGSAKPQLYECKIYDNQLNGINNQSENQIDLSSCQIFNNGDE